MYPTPYPQSENSGCRASSPQRLGDILLGIVAKWLEKPAPETSDVARTDGFEAWLLEPPAND